MSGPFSTSAQSIRHQRLLLDIKELTKNPYPNISLHVHDDDFTSACLVLTPEGYKPLHLTMYFDETYPVRSPRVLMNSANVSHPNIFDNYICADILKNGDGYTPAYTLKGIAIQLLSFFSSDKVDQDYGGRAISLARYRESDGIDNYDCDKCGFQGVKPPESATGFDVLASRSDDDNQRNAHGSASDNDNNDKPKESRRARKRRLAALAGELDPKCAYIKRLPNEVLLLVLEQLEDFQDLAHLARVWPRISRLIAEFDIVRQRELQCFCTKQSYRETKLGVGVSTHRSQLASEFDLLSEAAYKTLEIRQSVHSIRFYHWLPLPLSRRHWARVKDDSKDALESMKAAIRSKGGGGGGRQQQRPSHAEVLYTFMNDIVVRLNQAVKEWDTEAQKSTLRHASEKAIESYFHLFHLLVCLATEDPSVVRDANQLLEKFAGGQRSKTDCPNLGHLLIALLISDVAVTDELRKAIITEAVTRNVVWMLDDRGARLPELSYMETSPVSAYRLHKTFQSSRTSYRLLMFSELFRRIARPSSSSSSSCSSRNTPNDRDEGKDKERNKQQQQEQEQEQEQEHPKPLALVREELFDRHGAPPRGAAAHLAAEVRRLHTIDDFPSFLREMGVRHAPSAESFTAMLRQTVHDSMGSEKGYSKWAYTQPEALYLRLRHEPSVPCSLAERLDAQLAGRSLRWGKSFFPDRADGGAGGGSGGGSWRGGGGGGGRGFGGRGGGRGHRGRGAHGGGRGRGGGFGAAGGHSQ